MQNLPGPHPLCHQEVLVVAFFICIFLMANEVDHLFYCPCLPSVCLWRDVCLDPLPMFGFSLLSFMSSLYILNINPVSDIWFAYLFSHSVGSVCLLSMAYYAVQKLFIWCRSISLFLLLLPLPWCQTHKVLEKTKVKGLPPVFFLGIYGFRSYVQVFNVRYKTLVHFACGCSVFPISFNEKFFLFPTVHFGSLIIN